MLLNLFKELSLHPKNAAELKGLILQLAVQGKLTAKWREENPDVEPASELLKRIEEEKERLIKEKKIKIDNALPRTNNEEVPFDLPGSWTWCKMIDICRVITDGTHHTPKYQDRGVPFLSVKDMSGGFLNFENTRFVSQETHNELIKRCHPEKHDILLTKVGTTGIAISINTDRAFSIFVSVALLKIFSDHLYTKFFEYCINSPFIKLQSKEGTEGVGNKNLVLRKIKAFDVPIPPLKEQQAIVNIVNQLFAEVEQLEQLTKERIQLKHDFASSALQRLVQAGNINGEWQMVQQHFHTFFNEKANVKKLRETILQLAVQGKLTTRWRTENPDTEPATELLKRIATEKQQLIQSGKIKKEKPLPPIKEEEIPFELQEGWVWCRLGEINYDVHYGYTASAKGTYSGVGLLRITDIQNNRVNWATVPDCDIREKDVEKYLIQKNDILIARTGGTIGKSFLVQDVFRKSVFASYLIRAIPVKTIDVKYAKLFIESPYYWEQLKENSQGTGQPNVNATSLKGLNVSLPPLQEQHAIVATVNTLMGLCDALDQEIGQQQSQVEELMRSCLREVLE